MPQRSPALREPEFYFKLKPTVKELLVWNENYRLKIIVGQKLDEKEKNRLEKVKKTLDQRVAKGVPVSPQEWQRLDRDVESLGIAVYNRSNMEIRFVNNITNAAAKIAAMWVDLCNDLENDFIGHIQFVEYLKCYQEVLQNTNGLDCYSKSPFDKIRESISKNIPLKN